MKNLRATLRGAGLAALLVPATVMGGGRADVRGMGMARTQVASARGLDAAGVNPAALALPDRGTVTVSILPVGVHVGSEIFDYGLYTEYFTGVDTDGGRVPRFLLEQDKQRILAAFREEVPATRIDVDVRLLGVSLRLPGVGMFALTVTEELTGMAALPRGFAAFLLNGNTPGSDYRLSGTSAAGSWTREYAFSYGGAIPAAGLLRSLAGGASLKLVHGFGYYEIRRFDTRMITAENGTLTGSVDFLSRSSGSMPFEAGYGMFPPPAGKGLGVDLGLAGEFTEQISFGVSMTDIGTMSWSRGLQEAYADTSIVVDDPLREDQRDAIEQVVKGKKREGGEFTTQLPTALRVGVAVELGTLLGGVGEGLLVAAEYHQGIVPGVRSILTPRGSLGVEYRPLQWLPLRTGVSVGGTDGLNLAMGFGVELGGFDFAVASENVTWLVQPGSFSYGSVAVGTRLRF